MRCKSCGQDLGDGMLPARCPFCGANLSNRTDRRGAGGAAESRQSVEGLTGIGKGSRKGRGGNVGRALVAVVLVAAFVAGVWYLLASLTQGTMTVPNVTGWRLERAQQELGSDGFSVTYSERPTLEGAAGTVVSQTPAAGEFVDAGSRVALVVARAPVMPDIVGKTQAEAEEALTAEGIDYQIVEEPGTGEPGRVLSATVGAGKTPTAGSVVQVAVGAALTVPEVVGKTQLEAQDALVQAGLVGTFKDAPAPSGTAVGSVLSTDPGAGTTVEKGSTVTVYVAASRQSSAKDTAQAVLGIVYDNGNPSAESIGEALRPHLSGSSRYADAAAERIWTGLVKAGGSVHAGTPSALQSLPRSIVSRSVNVADDGASASATVAVKWAWDSMGPGYEGVTSEDTHTVTMTFDGDGKLVTFRDPQTDVPRYTVSSSG